MNRFYYSDLIAQFLERSPDEILGIIETNNDFSHELTQKDAWIAEIRILQKALTNFEGTIYFEYSIPRMGKRVDVVLIISGVIFVLEFKIGYSEFYNLALDQVWDYALDLKNFHEPSHNAYIAPILIATQAPPVTSVISATPQNDNILFPIPCNVESLTQVIKNVIDFTGGTTLKSDEWERGRYKPTPTIIEAAMALYNGHSVREIVSYDADRTSLAETSETISSVILDSSKRGRKSICFVTGVPGAGKTLVGLNIATMHTDKNSALHSVFLSGNDPLVNILREALARDRTRKEKELGEKPKKGKARREVKAFIQNIHHFRDDCLSDEERAPSEHVAIFDEAQRAWDIPMLTKFMKSKKGRPDFNRSEPDFLISCLDRHSDWAVIVCLVGGGQEINTGEAGITEWIDSLNRSYPDWDIHISSKLTDSEYSAEGALETLVSRPNVTYNSSLHLASSMRSFRAENVSLLIKQMLDLDIEGARKTLAEVQDKYPIMITRDFATAKAWLKQKASASERYGMVVSSGAQRLKPYAVDVKSPMNPIHWFLDPKEDVRSSYYLEAVATEFHVQGLELDWACVAWDGDFRYTPKGWQHWKFKGNQWQHVHKAANKNYLKNAYRVLLTRARQGMVIVVPDGDASDETRKRSYYDSTHAYLTGLGLTSLD